MQIYDGHVHSGVSRRRGAERGRVRPRASPVCVRGQSVVLGGGVVGLMVASLINQGPSRRAHTGPRRLPRIVLKRTAPINRRHLAAIDRDVVSAIKLSSNTQQVAAVCLSLKKWHRFYRATLCPSAARVFVLCLFVCLFV